MSLVGPLPIGPAAQRVGQMPDDLSGEGVQFYSQSGSTIHGWLLPGIPGEGGVVLMHGARSNRLSMVSRARFLSQAGYAVLLFDFQAHGESTGEHVTFGYLESKDAQAALDFMHDRFPHEKIGVIGVSMGGAAAILATPPLKADALVMEMVYPTIKEAIANRLRLKLGTCGGSLTPLASLQFDIRLGFSAEQLRPIDHVTHISEPKLFIAGSEDRYTTLAESERLFNAACEPKEMWVVPGAGHVDLHAQLKDEYERRVLKFFGQNLKS